MKLPIKDVKTNPRNPRIIKDDKFAKLVQSLKDFPEMAEVREVVVNKDMIVLGGNMRLRAMKEAGWKEVPVKVVDWTQDKQDEFVAKDNASFGEWDWDAVANQYDVSDLADWGIDLPVYLEQDELSINRQGSLGTSLANDELRDSMSVVLTFDKAGFVEFMTYANYFRSSYGTDTVTDAIIRAVKEQYEDSIR